MNEWARRRRTFQKIAQHIQRHKDTSSLHATPCTCKAAKYKIQSWPAEGGAQQEDIRVFVAQPTYHICSSEPCFERPDIESQPAASAPPFSSPLPVNHPIFLQGLNPLLAQHSP